MTRATIAVRHELIGLLGVVERNTYLVKRYAIWEVTWFVWTIANTLNRYRVGILRLVSDPAARAPLFDAIDALATAVSSALRQSDEDE